MKRILFFILSPTFGSKRFRKFYEVLKNVSFVGLNYRNTNINTNGELFLMQIIKGYFSQSGKPLVLFDVGANIGNYSKELSRVFNGTDRSIYAFEPFSKAFRDLKKLENTIAGFQPYLLGFSDKREKVSFLSSTEFSEVSGLYNKDFSQYNFSLNASEQMEFDSIENFCAVHHIERIHFLKVDVEGHDFFVLKGAKSLLDAGKIDFIQFEYGAANYLSKTYLHDFFGLLSPNYRIYKSFRNGFVEIEKYNTDIEIHILSNYVAINKNLNYKP